MREEGVRAMQLAAGLVPAFIVAGLFEGLVTPSDAIPESLKVALGIATAVVFWMYLFLGGRAAHATDDDDTADVRSPGFSRLASL